MSTPPIASLLPEILARIFTLVDVKHEWQLFSQIQFCATRPYSTGSHLGLVSREWRNITLSYPSLWSSICVDMAQDPYPTEVLERAKTYLDRSKAHPLSVTVVFSDFTRKDANIILAGFGTPTKASAVDPEVGYLTVHRSLLNLIFLNAPRIQHLSLVFRNTDLPTFAFKFASEVQKRLESLKQLALFTWGEDPVKVIEEFTNSPSLHSVTLYNMKSNNHPRPPRPQNLESLHITDLTLLEANIGGIAILLPKFPYLRSVDLTLWTITSKLPDNIPKLSLTYVTDLSLGLGDLPVMGIVAALLHSLNIPSLTALRLHADHDPTLHLQPKFSAFVHAVSALVRRCPNIESLCLERIPFKDDALLSILDDLPELGVLDVTNMNTDLSEGHSVTSYFLKELGSREVVPKLKDLRVLQYASPLEKGVVEGMLSSRRDRAPGFCLRSAYLLVERSAVPMLDLELLREMQRRGLAVRVATKQKGKEVEVLGYEIGE